MTGKQWEIHAAYGGLTAGDLGRIMGDRKLDPATQAELLAAALAMPFKETGRSHYRTLVEGEPGPNRFELDQIQPGLAWLERLELEGSPVDAFAALPCYSFALELRIVLARPYLSRDDDPFYIIDNPVRKDKVFQVPFVAPTSWKGSLRAAATQGLLAAWADLLPAIPPTEEAVREDLLGTLWAERVRRVVVFGNEKENHADLLNGWLAPRLYPQEPGESKEDRQKRLKKQAGKLGKAFDDFLVSHGYRLEKVEGRQGRLFAFPTFFDQIGLEMINPHDRQRRVGKNPILFECVPAGATGTFRLLYVPYDYSLEGVPPDEGVPPGGRLCVTPDEATLRAQVQADLPLVAGAVRDLLLVYGFGAKTSSGFGAAHRSRVTGELCLNCLREGAAEGAGPSEALVRRLLADDPLRYRLDDAFFVDGQFQVVADDEIRAQPWGGRTKAAYRKVKPRVLELLAGHPAGPAYLARAVTDLEDLPDLARELAAEIGGGA